jgi:hypothetical protein
MSRFGLLLRNEFKLFRTSVPIHLVAMLQPTLMYVLMSVILVSPTFDMQIAQPLGEVEKALVSAMVEVGSPIGQPYINPVPVDWDGGHIPRQVIQVEDRGGIPTAVQHYGLIDSNLVKNFRNRLTAAGLRLWNEELGARAVTVAEHPWLPRDVPYSVYFGMAMLPMAAFVAASMLGTVLTTQEFEVGTIVEYRLAPTSMALILGSRLTRLVLSASVGSGLMLVAVGVVTGAWPSSPWLVPLILLPVAIVAASLGTVAGLVIRQTIPAFLVALVSSFAGWLLGSAFGLAAGFSTSYERVSRLTPFTHATELLFPRYYDGITVGTPWLSVLVLVLYSAGMLVLTVLAYRWRVMTQM